MDADYARNLDEAGAPVGTFRHALFVLATVMSAARPGIAVLDAGHKAVAVDSGLPTVWQRPDVRYTSASDEHGKLEVGVGDGGAEAGREAAPGAGALRPDGGPLRLVCRRARRPGGVPVAGGGTRRDELTGRGRASNVMADADPPSTPFLSHSQQNHGSGPSPPCRRMLGRRFSRLI